MDRREFLGCTMLSLAGFPKVESIKEQNKAAFNASQKHIARRDAVGKQLQGAGFVLKGMQEKPLHMLGKLLENPNPYDTFGALLYRCYMQLDATKQALVWMLPNKLGLPMELHSIPTATAIPQSAVKPDYPDGYYRIQPLHPISSCPKPSEAIGTIVPAQWMLSIRTGMATGAIACS